MMDEAMSPREARLRQHLEAAKKAALDPEILRQVHAHHRSGQPMVLELYLDTDVPLVELLVNAAVAAMAPGVTAVNVRSLKHQNRQATKDPSKQTPNRILSTE